MSLFEKKTGVAAFVDGIGRTANGFVAGLAAGAIASYVMNQYQAIEGKPVAVRKREAAEAASAAQSNSGGGPQKQSQAGGEDNAPVAVAQAASRNLFEHELTGDEKPAAGAAVHYGYGAAVGGLYGGLAEVVPAVGLGLGIPYATLLWLLGDEIAVPALGLSKPPTEQTAGSHASSLAAHFVYGATLDISRRILKHII